MLQSEPSGVSSAQQKAPKLRWNIYRVQGAYNPNSFAPFILIAASRAFSFGQVSLSTTDMIAAGAH